MISIDDEMRNPAFAAFGDLTFSGRSFLDPLIIAVIVSLLLIGTGANATKDEAWGTVTNVVDGDTFDVTIEKASDRVTYAVERIRLADVDSPEMDSDSGTAARDFTYAILMNKKVFLDIDDQSSNGRDDYGRLICVVYLSGFYGQPITSPCYNRLLVDCGHASLTNFTNNEFDPRKWWSDIPESDSRQIDDDAGQNEQQNQSQDENANQSHDLANEVKNTWENELLPRLQDSAEKELDQMEREGWSWLKGKLGLNNSTSK